MAFHILCQVSKGLCLCSGLLYSAPRLNNATTVYSPLTEGVKSARPEFSVFVISWKTMHLYTSAYEASSSLAPATSHRSYIECFSSLTAV